jgi:hypothetical protein
MTLGKTFLWVFLCAFRMKQEVGASWEIAVEVWRRSYRIGRTEGGNFDMLSPTEQPLQVLAVIERKSIQGCLVTHGEALRTNTTSTCNDCLPRTCESPENFVLGKVDGKCLKSKARY